MGPGSPFLISNDLRLRLLLKSLPLQVTALFLLLPGPDNVVLVDPLGH